MFAVGFVMGPPTLAAGPHAHDKPAAAAQLRLDHGKTWPTDDILRRGMGDIRLAMTQSLTPIHSKAFTPAQYEALARVSKRRSTAGLRRKTCPTPHIVARADSCRLCGHGLVNVLFLSSVHAYQRLDRLDHSLSVSNEIAVDLFRRQILRDPRE